MLTLKFQKKIIFRITWKAGKERKKLSEILNIYFIQKIQNFKYDIQN